VGVAGRLWWGAGYDYADASYKAGCPEAGSGADLSSYVVVAHIYFLEAAWDTG
jgi:hypothetical protein